MVLGQGLAAHTFPLTATLQDALDAITLAVQLRPGEPLPMDMGAKGECHLHLGQHAEARRPARSPACPHHCSLALQCKRPQPPAPSPRS